jgi:hypothetical protein
MREVSQARGGPNVPGSAIEDNKSKTMLPIEQAIRPGMMACRARDI